MWWQPHVLLDLISEGSDTHIDKRPFRLFQLGRGHVQLNLALLEDAIINYREALACAAHRFKCILSLYVLRHIHVVLIDSFEISFKELCFVWAMALFEVDE